MPSTVQLLLYKFYKWYHEEPAFILKDEICRTQWLEDVFPTEIVPFLGDMLVFGGLRKSQLLRKYDGISAACNASTTKTEIASRIKKLRRLGGHQKTEDLYLEDHLT